MLSYHMWLNQHYHAPLKSIEMAQQAEEILRKEVMQARIINEDTVRVNVRLDNVKDNKTFKFIDDDWSLYNSWLLYHKYVTELLIAQDSKSSRHFTSARFSLTIAIRRFSSLVFFIFWYTNIIDKVIDLAGISFYLGELAS